MTTPFFIGVSGHQNLGNEATQRFVADQFRALLRTYQKREQSIILYSALAMGADQLFVQIALEMGVSVEIVLPCAEYEAIFSSDDARNEYHRLLNACSVHHQLPAQTCSDEAFLAAGQWIVDHSDLLILAWNGFPPRGRGGTGDVASYARYVGRPFIHLHTRKHYVTSYQAGSSRKAGSSPISPRRDFALAKQAVYQGPTLTVTRYLVSLPDGKELIRDVVERPESVLVLPIGPENIVLLVEEYDFGAGVWQLKLPGGKIERSLSGNPGEQAQRELRQEIGYRAERLEALSHFYSHPGYISHKVHTFIAQDLEWDPLPGDTHEEIKVHTYTLKEALAETFTDDRFDPESALVLWLYTHRSTF